MYMTDHARLRGAQRCVSLSDAEFIIKYGNALHNAGGTFYQLRRKDIPDTIAANDRRRKLEGTTVFTCRCGDTMITTYRNPRAFKHDSKKKKYQHPARIYHECPNCEKDNH